jgi:myo-inositol-1(or 4)-monophosphatase
MLAILNIAINAARKGGALLVRERERLGTQCTAEHLAYLQQQAGVLMEEIIHKSQPEHTIIMAHGEQPETKSDIVWHIEVVSGLENLSRHIPHYAIVIVIDERNKPRHTLVYDPNCEEIYTASVGGGAKCNNYRIRVNSEKTTKGCLIATSTLQANQLKDDSVLKDLNNDGATFYNQGCAALSLAYVAAGRLDSFYGIGLSRTENAAGALLIKEAGGLVGDLQGGPGHLDTGELLGADAKLFKILVKQFIKK